MKTLLIALIGLTVSFVLTPYSKAQQVSSVFSFVQKVEPAISGAAAGILGTGNGKASTGTTNNVTPTVHSGGRSRPGYATISTANTRVPSCRLEGKTCVLIKTQDPIPAAYPGVSLDTIGIKPGMSLKAVEKIVVSQYKKKPFITSQRADYSYKGGLIKLKSQPFVVRLFDSNALSNVDVYFGTPATGNTVVAVSHHLEFPNALTAPTLSAVFAALDKKYGPETLEPGETLKESHTPPATAMWVFRKHKLIKSLYRADSPCLDNEAGPAGEGFMAPDMGDRWKDSDLLNAFQGQKAISKGEYVCVDASIGMAGNTSRVMSIDIFINDPADKVLTIEEAAKQMHPAAVIAYREESKPEQVPKL